MKVIGLDGRPHRLWGEELKQEKACSAGHLRARTLLRHLYPLDPLWEEVFVPGCPARLMFDFLLPRRLLVVEVQGRQHREEVSYFHGQGGLAWQKARDQYKRDFCTLNHITLVELDDDQEDGRWLKTLQTAITNPGSTA